MATVGVRMSNTDERSADVTSHTSAATAFARNIRNSDIRSLESLILFGSTVRGEAAGLESDVDFLAIVSDDADKQAVEDTLRDIAYEVMLEHGPVVEVHVLSHSMFEQRRDHPFIRRAVREGDGHV